LVLIGIPIASILVPALLTWARDLDAPSRRIRKLDEQSKIVAFWDGWLKTVTATKPADNRFHQKSEARIVAITREARHALADAGSSALLIYRLDEYRAYHVRRRDYRKYKLNFEEFQRYRKTLPWYRRALLLYKAPNPQALGVKASFYFNIIFPFIFIPIMVLSKSHLVQTKNFLHSFMPEYMTLHQTLINWLIPLVVIGQTIWIRHYAITFENDPRYYIRKQSTLPIVDGEAQDQS
jgi:hypothetical protein